MRIAMRFPEISRENDDVHANAVERRDDAREGYRHLVGLATAAVGTPCAAEAADLRDAARARLASRDAWVGWVEHGV
jgi:hypothetical protein